MGRAIRKCRLIRETRASFSAERRRPTSIPARCAGPFSKTCVTKRWVMERFCGSRCSRRRTPMEGRRWRSLMPAAERECLVAHREELRGGLCVCEYARIQMSTSDMHLATKKNRKYFCVYCVRGNSLLSPCCCHLPAVVFAGCVSSCRHLSSGSPCVLPVARHMMARPLIHKEDSTPPKNAVTRVPQRKSGSLHPQHEKSQACVRNLTLNSSPETLRLYRPHSSGLFLSFTL